MLRTHSKSYLNTTNRNILIKNKKHNLINKWGALQILAHLLASVFISVGSAIIFRCFYSKSNDSKSPKR